MSVDELHGVFQFTDDLFEDTRTPERIFTIDSQYTPREIYPCWFEKGTESIATAHEAKNPIDTVEFLLPELYRRGDFEECLRLCIARMESSSTPGVLRDAAETASLCLLKLKRPEEALPLLHFMTGVEEPGRLIVRSKVFFECKNFIECIKECKEYLNLRSGDYSMSLRLLECLIETDPQSSEISELFQSIETTLNNSLVSSQDDSKLKQKYQQDLAHLMSFLDQ